jgi:hypothetical protein
MSFYALPATPVGGTPAKITLAGAVPFDGGRISSFTAAA